VFGLLATIVDGIGRVDSRNMGSGSQQALHFEGLGGGERRGKCIATFRQLAPQTWTRRLASCGTRPEPARESSNAADRWRRNLGAEHSGCLC
jgi:hypothetical protein